MKRLAPFPFFHGCRKISHIYYKSDRVIQNKMIQEYNSFVFTVFTAIFLFTHYLDLCRYSIKGAICLKGLTVLTPDDLRQTGQMALGLPSHTVIFTIIMPCR
jgi:hypothetical protein